MHVRHRADHPTKLLGEEGQTEIEDLQPSKVIVMGKCEGFFLNKTKQKTKTKTQKTLGIWINALTPIK